jgi:peroxiredoxin
MKGLAAALALLAQAVAAPASAPPDLVQLLAALQLGGYAPHERPPSFEGRTTLGQAVSLDDLRGKVVVLTFSASWCPPCRLDLAALEDLGRSQGDEGLAIVAVNVRERPTVVRDYADTLGLSFPVLLDRRGDIQASYGVIGLPTTFVIARDGRAVARAIGPRDWSGSRFRELIAALLGEAGRP